MDSTTGRLRHGWFLCTAGLVVFALCAERLPAQLAEVNDDGTTTAETQPAETTAESQPTSVQNDAVRMTRPGTFEIHYRNADLRGVLQLLGSQGRKNIIATQEVTGTFTGDLYDVTFDEALEAILRASGYVYEKKGNFIYVYTPKQLEEIQKAQRKVVVRTFHLSYITANDAKTLITPLLSKDAGSVSITPDAAVGIATSKTESGGNSYATTDVLVICDYEENMKRIAKVLDELDVKPDQVLIEATILRATLNEDNALGVDFNTLAGIDFEQMNSTSPGLQSMTTGDVTGDTLNRQYAQTFRTDFNSAIPTGGMTFGFIMNETAFFVRALETVTDVTVMANPKLLVVNKQRGEVMVGNRDGYLTTTVTDTVATQTVEFLETGTRLIVRPFIAKNGYVRLEIHPEDSSGSVSQIGTNVLPSETTTEVTSNVLVRDGHTIVIGGLFRERTSNGRSQVPIAGNVPYLGTLFRQTSDSTIREEVIILVTPRIIRQAADEATSEQLADDAERFRIGQRKGLRWWGRQPLAQAWMRQAKRDIDKGKLTQAEWCIDQALSLSPRMEEAIRLKEQLSKEAYWSDEAQVSSAKYIVQRMIMQDMGKPVQRIIPPGKPLDDKVIPSPKPNVVAPEVRKAMGVESRPVQPLGAKQIGPEVILPPPADKSVGDKKTTATENRKPATQPAGK